MRFFTSSPLPPPRIDGEHVRAGLRRHDPNKCHHDFINPEGANGAVAGPPGFSLWLLSPNHEPKARCAPQHHHRLLLVRRGAVKVLIGPEQSVERLGLRDALLMAPGTEHWIVPIDENSEIVGFDYRERDLKGQFITGGHMRSGIARHSLMRPLCERFPMRLAPQIGEILSPGELYLIAGPVQRGPGRAEVFGPAGLVVAIARAPRFTGPALHIHTLSLETFLILEGQFQITWGDKGEYEEFLNAGDMITIPRGVNRTFEAVSDGDNWILPLVVGADDETDDIVWFPEVAQELAEVHPIFTALATRTHLRIASRALR